MKWFVLKDMLDKTYENLNKHNTNLKVHAMFGTDRLLTGVQTHSVIFLQVLIDISYTNIIIELQINRIYHGHIQNDN